MQKVVIVFGRDSHLLFGDDEAEDDRFFEPDGAGGLRGIALPVLQREGWKIAKVFEMGNSVFVLMKSGDEGANGDEGEEA